MAGIDKTYIYWKEYPTYRQWWIDNYNKMKKELGHTIYLYPFQYFRPFDPKEYTPQFLKENTQDLESCKNIAYEFPVWNTSEKVDMWLIKNCNIQSFQKRLRSVYPRHWKGFKIKK